MPKKVLFTILCLSIFLSGFSQPAPVSRRATPNELIEAVNAMRAEYGLAPYTVDESLMAIAQAQSDYQASIDTTTHTRPDGSNADTLVSSENIQPGTAGMSAATIVQRMTYDYPHTITLIGFKTGRAGAGAATGSDGVIYYTLDVINTGGALTGLTAGSSASVSNSTDAGSSDATLSPSYYGILTSTPGLDGSVQHVVNSGQTLIGIAAAYEMDIKTLSALNQISTSDLIYPGDMLLIQPSSIPTYTETATLQETTAPATLPPVVSPVTDTPAFLLSPTPVPARSSSWGSHSFGILLMIIILSGMALLGLGLIGWSKRDHQ